MGDSIVLFEIFAKVLVKIAYYITSLFGYKIAKVFKESVLCDVTIADW